MATSVTPIALEIGILFLFFYLALLLHVTAAILSVFGFITTLKKASIFREKMRDKKKKVEMEAFKELAESVMKDTGHISNPFYQALKDSGILAENSDLPKKLYKFFDAKRMGGEDGKGATEKEWQQKGQAFCRPLNMDVQVGPSPPSSYFPSIHSVLHHYQLSDMDQFYHLHDSIGDAVLGRAALLAARWASTDGRLCYRWCLGSLQPDPRLQLPQPAQDLD